MAFSLALADTNITITTLAMSALQYIERPDIMLFPAPSDID
jgi:hypothetical protein